MLLHERVAVTSAPAVRLGAGSYVVRVGNVGSQMSALGHKQTFHSIRWMSALPRWSQPVDATLGLTCNKRRYSLPEHSLNRIR